MVSLSCVLTATLPDRTPTQSGLGPFYSTPKRHPGMSLSCCSRRPDRTRHASAVSFLLLLFFAELFNFKTTLLPTIYGCCSDLPLMPRLPFSLMPSLIQRSARRRCRLPLVAFSVSSPFVSYALVVQAPFQFLALIVLVLLYHHPLFTFSFFFIIWAFNLLVIDAYYVSFPHTLSL